MKNFSYNNMVTLMRTIYKGIGSLLQQIGDAMVKSITIGTVTTGEPGTDAGVSNSGTEQDVVLDFVIPRGDAGQDGAVNCTYDEDTETLTIS